ncbi:DNA polymerase III subunit beta [Candidatus Saccharibacteria bacterium]|nr:DNA polymerase III subunit beta [Candidatus Saccharibacteria bacterium]
MEIEVISDKLSRALSNVSRIAAGKVTLPVLNNVLIKVKDKKVSLITTNLDMAIIDFLPVSSSKDGVITLPAKLLTEFISNLPKSTQVKVSSKDTKVTVVADKYSSTINGSLADDFPELPEIDEKSAVAFSMDVEEFKNGINQVIIASSNDFNRPALTGVHFYTNDKSLYIVATDGYRVAKKKMVDNVKSEIKVTIPANTLQEVLRSINDEMDEIEISFNEDLVRFRLGEIEIISKLIDAEYPNIDSLIPKTSEINIIAERDELLRIAKLASLFARHGANDAITCETKTPDTFSIHAIANEFGENDSIINTKVDNEGKITITSKYFIDALSVVDSEKIHIAFSTGIDKNTNISAPMVIKKQNSDDYVYILMPLDS